MKKEAFPFTRIEGQPAINVTRIAFLFPRLPFQSCLLGEYSGVGLLPGVPWAQRLFSSRVWMPTPGWLAASAQPMLVDRDGPHVPRPHPHPEKGGSLEKSTVLFPRLQGQPAEVGSKEPLGCGTGAAFPPAQAQVTGGSSMETLETMQTDYRTVRSPRDKDENDLGLISSSLSCRRPPCRSVSVGSDGPQVPRDGDAG